jgi:hypothetical protein
MNLILFQNQGRKKDRLVVTERKGVARKTSVDTVVLAKELSLLEEAAARTGYHLSVVAREGQNYSYTIDRSTETDTVTDRVGRDYMTKEKQFEVTRKLIPGEVAISVSAPQGRTDYTPFWHTYNALKPTPPGKKA